MKRLIYTAVFGGYDRVYPPMQCEPDVDYCIVTDDASIEVRGWKTHVVNAEDFETPKSANLYYRALVHRVLPGYDASLYVDGNVRLKYSSADLFDALTDSGSAIIMFKHPLRISVKEELSNVLLAGKLKHSEVAQREFLDYINDGFQDDVGLGETGIMLKNHNHPQLDDAMVLWWEKFRKYLTRDQLSLPYVIWKTDLPISWLAGSFRNPNPHFALYPHQGAVGVNPIYVHVSARSHDSFLYRIILVVWHGQWRLRRIFRGAAQ